MYGNKMRQKLKILLVSHDFSVTGAPNSLLRQAKYFRAAGHDVDIWSLNGGGLLPRYLEAGFCPIVIENRRSVIDRVYRHLNKRYDFILCNTTVTYKVVDVLSRYNTPLVWFIRETKLVDDGMRENPNFARTFSNFYNLYTVSPYAASVSRKYNKNVRVITNAIADSFDGFKKTGDKIVFGYIGSIIDVKGVDFLVDAFMRVAEKHDNIELRIAGFYNSEYGNRLREKAKNCANVVWLGELQGAEKRCFFDSIDVLCVPSLDDPCPLTVIEGAMHGKALIVTENTGSNYIVKNGFNGFVVKTADADALAAAMTDVLGGDIDQMKFASREMYLKYGTTEREEREVLKMLYDNLDNKPSYVIKWPRWVGGIVCCFIPSKKNRSNFRKKYVRTK